MAPVDSPQPDRSKPQRRRIRTFDWSTGAIALLSAVAAGIVYVREGREHFLTILGGDVTLFAYMMPKVLAGCVIGALVTLVLPREVIARWVGEESGLVGLLIAFVAGLILPGGPLTIFPVAGAFLAIGADAGAIVVFVTAWSLLGYQRALVWELPFFGPHFVIWRIIVAIPLPLLAGLIARLVVRVWSGRSEAS